jgi:tetratricopeptide (TPR) repeat protein
LTKGEELQKARILIQEEKPELALEMIKNSLMNHKDGAAVLRTLDAKVLKRPALPAELVSLYGVCIAMAENRTQRGIMFCKMAISMDIHLPEVYVNLARLYVKADQKGKAIQTLRKGLECTGNHTSIIEVLAELGVRRPPPIPFLPRRNFLNKYLGMYLYRRKKAREAKKSKKQ